VTGDNFVHGQHPMRPLGYMLKRVASRPEGLAGPHVIDVYSLSGHVSPDFADYIRYWRHNVFWLFDAPSVLRAVAEEHSIPREGLTLFYYEAYERQYDAAQRAWVPFDRDPALETNVQPPPSCVLEGFDVVSFSAGTSPECSPLSCNGVAAQVPTNSHCLFSSIEEAIAALEQGRFENTEPGPYRVIGVHSVQGA